MDLCEVESRIRYTPLHNRIMSAMDAASFIEDGMTVGISGFTRAGDAKAVPMALAERVKESGESLHINLWTGASVAEQVDETLTEAGVIARRLPYQTNKVLRDAINRGEVMYMDQHLSLTGEWVREGQMGRLDVAIVEAVAITEQGGIILSTSVGNSPVFARYADKVIVELNCNQSPLLEGIHDIYIPGPRSHREPLQLWDVRDRIGTPYTYVDPNKIVAIVPTEQVDHFVDFAAADGETEQIANYLLTFFEQEIELGRMTYTLRPLQSGVGSVSNAVLAGLSRSHFHDLLMYSEVLQDGVFDLLDSGKLNFASATAISLSPRRGREVMERLNEYRDRLILRPQEISNHPQLIRQLGIIAMNTALEADIYGNVNSTHVMGTHIMNGIGGSGDFARNAYLSIFVTKSTAKGGKISSIVPMVSHVDHTEHDVEILVTEQGLADLRGLAPRERAEVIIEKCAHPSFQPALRAYYEEALKNGGQTPHVLEKALSWHARYRDTGSML